MSLKLYKNETDVQESKTSIEGLRWSPTDASLLIREKAKAFEDPASQTIDFAVEMHVYTPDGSWIAGDHRLESAKIPSIASRRPKLQIDVQTELKELGIERGSYKLVFNFIKSLLGNTENRSVFIKEISPNRKEVWLTLADPLQTELTPDDDIRNTLGRQFRRFRYDTNRRYGRGYSNLVLNLGNNNIFKVVNARIGGNTIVDDSLESPLYKGQNIYLKLYDKLPSSIVPKQRAWIGQEDKRPYIESINVYPPIVKETFNTIKGPNFEIDQQYTIKTETDFKSWNELLDTNTGTSQQIIDKYFSGSLSGIDVNLDYSKFDNFVNYSSAEERIKNFEYKLQLIEYFDTQNYILDAAVGSDSSSLQNNIGINTARKNEVIGGFDGFERWAYNESTSSIYTHGVSGSKVFAEDYVITPYPKYIENGDWKLHHTTSSYGENWLNGLVATASNYDLENENSLINTIPENIQRDKENDQYVLFVNMIGHHFDILYTYIRELTKIHSPEENPKLGAPSELLYDVAKSMGWQLANGNQSEQLWQYKLGKNVSGSYASTGDMFSKSSESMTQEVWRRIVNNLPYLLKTKGTKRSIYALMNTYGIPQTLLSIREYGGPKQEEQHPDLIEDRFSYAVDMRPGARIKLSNDQITATQEVHGSTAEIPIQTHQVRFRPGMTSSMHIMTRVYDANNSPGAEAPNWTVALQHTASYSGSGKYGRLHFGIVSNTGGASASMTEWLPIYDGNFWNMQIGYTTTGTHFNTGSNTDTTYTLHVQHASDYITGKVIHSDSASITPSTGSHYANWGMGGTNRHIILGGSTGSNGTSQNALKAAISASFGVIGGAGKVIVTDTSGNPGIFPGVFSGSMQEYRGWSEAINKTTLDTHTLNPTSYVGSLSTTSSFDTLLFHYPLGSDTIAIDHSSGTGLFISSSHPNQDRIDPSKTVGDGMNTYASASGFNTPASSDLTTRGNYERVTETYYVDAPSIGGTNTKSQKIRIEDNKLVGRLDPESSAERSTFDYATLDSNRLGVFYSAADQINKDIFNQLGAFALDNYIGDPSDEFNNNYPKLENLAQEYWKKYSNKNDVNAYIRVFSLFDFSLFSQIRQLLPVRTDAALGLLIEPNVLERSKVQLYKLNQPENLAVEQRIPVLKSKLIAEPHHYTGSVADPRDISSEHARYTSSISDPRTVTSSAVSFTDQREMTLFTKMEYVQPSWSMRYDDVEGTLDATNDVSASSEIPSNEGVNVNQWNAHFASTIHISSASSFTPTEYDHKNFIFHQSRTSANGTTTIYTASNQSVAGPIVLPTYLRERNSQQDGQLSGSDVIVVDYDRNAGASNAIQAVVLEQRKHANPIYSQKKFYYGPKDDVVRYYPLEEWNADGRMHDKTKNARHSMFYYYVSASSNSGPLGVGENGAAGKWNEGGAAAYIGMRYRYLHPTGSVASGHFKPAVHEYWQGNLMHFRTYLHPGDPATEGNYYSQGQNTYTGGTHTVTHTPSGSTDARVKHGQRGAQAIKVPRIGGGSGSRGSDYPWSMTWLMQQCSGSRNQEMWVFGWNNAHAKSKPPVSDVNTGTFSSILSGLYGGYHPAIGIDHRNRMFLRDQAKSFWYPKLYSTNEKDETTPDFNQRLNGIKYKSGSNLHGESDRRGIGNKFGFNREHLNHYSMTYKPSGSLGILTFYVNGEYLGEHRKDVTVGANPYKTGSFFFDSIGQGYAHSNGWTYGFSGSLGQVRYYERCLSPTEVSYANKYPHKNPHVDNGGKVIFTRGNSGVSARGKQFLEKQTSYIGPKAKNVLFKTETDYPFLPTSSSLHDTSYQPDDTLSVGMRRLYFEGCKLSGPDFNINSTETTDGGPVVSFTNTNPNTLTTKEGALRVN